MMEDLKLTNCENAGKEIVVVLGAFVAKETGLLVISQFDKDAIEITKEQALELSAYILRNYEWIVRTEEYYNR